MFTEITLAQQEQIEKIRRVNGHRLSSHAFSSLFIWEKRMQLSIALWPDGFCVRRQDGQPGRYFFPCGTDAAKRRMIAGLLKDGAQSFQYVRREDMCFLEESFPGVFSFTEARDDWEYLYDRKEQVSLAGGHFRHLRGKVNRGRKLKPWQFLSLTEDTLPHFFAATEQWGRKFNGNAINADLNETKRALTYWRQLSLFGLLLWAEGKPCGFAVGDMLTDNVFDLHISKTLLPDMDCYLKWELYCRLPEQVRQINREEDLGVPGLRQHKLEMMPSGFQQLWIGRVLP